MAAITASVHAASHCGSSLIVVAFGGGPKSKAAVVSGMALLG